ncbi:MAG TPA: hypothetical protein VMR37_01890 [Rhabdochlamydiaceae bacterium]|nr:hypothetical protein [Rhabdochlamydiaceae bacterium]
MNFKQILGAIVFVGGIVLLCIAHYINVQIEEGNTQIFSAQKKVNQTNSLFGMSPYTKSVGKGFTSGAQGQINEGMDTVTYYTMIAQRCQIGGIVCLIVGAGMMYLLRRKRR